MSSDPSTSQLQIDSGRSSCGVQGCLFGAVALFVLLLIGLLVLGYIQFRENTAPGANPEVGGGIEYETSGGPG